MPHAEPKLSDPIRLARCTVGSNYSTHERHDISEEPNAKTDPYRIPKKTHILRHTIPGRGHHDHIHSPTKGYCTQQGDKHPRPMLRQTSSALLLLSILICVPPEDLDTWRDANSFQHCTRSDRKQLKLWGPFDIDKKEGNFRARADEGKLL